MERPASLAANAAHRALQAYARLLGPEHVHAADPHADMSDPLAFDRERHRPAGRIAPADIEEVRAALRVAAQYDVPLWPISRGKNLGYGGAAARVAGTIMLDLSRLRQIAFDAASGTVVVEPGVSFYDLHDYLQTNALPYWLSVPANSWGSVLGNALDRGLGFGANGDHAGSIRGLEIVLADGDVVRTGTAALTGGPGGPGGPGWTGAGLGPSADQLFVQSNLGIVTRMSLALMPRPEAMLGLELDFDRAEDIAAIIDTLAPMRRERLLTANPVVQDWLAVAALRSRRGDWIGASEPLCQETAATIRHKLGIGWWRVSLRVHGRTQVARAALAVVEREVARLRPSRLERTAWHDGDPPDHSLWGGTPGSHALTALNWHRGRGGQSRSSVILPHEGGAALAWTRDAEITCRTAAIDCETRLVVDENRVIGEWVLAFDQDDPAMTARVEPLMRALIAQANKAGLGTHRTHLAAMDLAAQGYGWNDGALMRLNERLKDALDPQGLIAPGKSGIGGRSYRRRVAT